MQVNGLMENCRENSYTYKTNYNTKFKSRKLHVDEEIYKEACSIYSLQFNLKKVEIIL